MIKLYKAGDVCYTSQQYLENFLKAGWSEIAPSPKKRSGIVKKTTEGTQDKSEK